jgi:hypothetical protein
MKYAADDFKKCRFNPLTEELYDSNPSLETVMGKCIDDENIVRYIIMVYDPDSVLVHMEPNLEKRKAAAVDLAGITSTTKAESLMELTEEKYVNAIVCYLINFTNSRLWQRVAVNEQLYEEYCKRLLQPVRAANVIVDDEGKKGMRQVQEKDELAAYTIKAKLREELDAIGAALDGYYRQLFGNDEQLVKKNKVRFTPEMMAGI